MGSIIERAFQGRSHIVYYKSLWKKDENGVTAKNIQRRIEQTGSEPISILMELSPILSAPRRSRSSALRRIRKAGLFDLAEDGDGDWWERPESGGGNDKI